MTVVIVIVVCLAAAVALGLAGFWWGSQPGDRSRSVTIGLIAVIGLALAGGGGLWLVLATGSTPAQSGEAKATEPRASESPNNGGPVVPVHTRPARHEKIARTVTVYGVTAAEPGAALVVSVPYESQVSKVLVNPGEQIQAQTPLVALAPSPNTKLKLTQARNRLQSTGQNLKRVKQQVSQRLATNADLAQARSAHRSAQAELKSLTDRGAATNGPQRLTASQAGVVSTVAVQPGQVVGPGATLVKVIPRGRIEVRLGLNPRYLAYLHQGQQVQLEDVYAADAPPVMGRLRQITQRVDPRTRLVDAYARFSGKRQSNSGPSDRLLLNTFVRAQLTLESHKALVVPKAAVLAQADSQVLYTVDHAKAVEHTVSTGITENQAVELTDAGGVKPGDAVVVVGNAELSDGMAVQSRPSTKAPAHPAKGTSSTGGDS